MTPVDAVLLTTQRCPLMGVSNPTNFTHKVHVGFDPLSGGFTGLPPEWAKLLDASAITREDYAKNPQAVIEVLEFYSKETARAATEPDPHHVHTPHKPKLTKVNGVDQMVYQTLGVNGNRGPPPPRLPIDRAMGGMNMSNSSNIIPSRAAPRPPNIETQSSYSSDRGPPTPGTPSSYNSTSPLNPHPPPMINRPTPQLTPPTSSSSPNGMTTSSTSQSLNNKFTPQRAAPLTPQQRQEQLTREAERRRRERENKELPQPNVPRSTPATTTTPPIASSSVSSSSASAAAAIQPPRMDTRAPPPITTTKKPKEQRISGLSESQIMERLRAVVSSDDPNKSYTKIKKVGQGASGSVYVARFTSPEVGRKLGASGRVLPSGSNNNKVAIKQMDLANQPRKELIVNEILVMKESQHPNIVNFLDSYLVRGNELWVVMEFMEGGALTDVIDHNTLSEDQISCISLEVSTTANTPAFPFSFHVLS